MAALTEKAKEKSVSCTDGAEHTEARVYRAFGERVVLEKNASVGYDLPHQLFDRWWLVWFYDTAILEEVDYEVAGLALHFMAAMVEAGDA